MAGSEDRAVPVAAGRDLGKSIPGVRYVELDQAGHMITLEQGQRVAEEIRSLLAR
jgi:pimeloyl-ACP methyl ester carboxylesterase